MPTACSPITNAPVLKSGVTTVSEYRGPGVRHGLLLFLVVPACFNLLLVSLYYSGHPGLQYLVAPQIDWLHHRSWREFGLLEMLQNLLLLAIVVLFAIAAMRRCNWLEKLFYFIGALLMLFLLLEEIDYGIHYYEFLTGKQVAIDGQYRNIHNLQIDGRSLGGRLKKVANVVTIVWFILVPILAGRANLGPLQRLVPRRWFILGFAVSLLFSSLAHHLDQLGLDVIDGVEGALKHNVSEFREASTYYLYFLYALQLFATPALFAGNRGETQTGA